MKIDYKLKIIEQIIAVMVIAVLTPMIVSGIIINNVNQQSVRRELDYSVSVLSEVVVKNIETYFYAAKGELNTITMALKHIPNSAYRQAFFDAIRAYSTEITDVKLEDIEYYNKHFKGSGNYYYDKEEKPVSMKFDNSKHIINNFKENHNLKKKKEMSNKQSPNNTFNNILNNYPSLTLHLEV